MKTNKLIRVVAFSVILGVGAGCASSSVCDKASKWISGNPTAECSGFESVSFSATECVSALSACSSEETGKLEQTLACLEQLGTCNTGSEASFRQGYDGCLTRLESVSTPCARALWGAGGPGTGSQTDGGQNGGLSGIEDGGHGVELVAVASENEIAAAWTPLQLASVSSWELHSQTAAAVKFPTVTMPGDKRIYSEEDAGTNLQKIMFLVGRGARNELVYGVPAIEDGGAGGSAVGCQSPTDCATHQVCDLGVCKTQSCRDSSTCPNGYICFEQNFCLRSNSAADAGVDAGPTVNSSAPLPFISNSVTVRTGKPVFAAQRIVNGFEANEPQILGFDTARQFVAMEQENQLWGHFTANRGKTFQKSRIDTLGTRIRLAFEPTQELVYACYNVGYGTRVRLSRDFGRTWDAKALTLENETPDGGTLPTRIRDCDIAAWKNGQALLVTVEGAELEETLRVRAISPQLEVVEDDEAFVSSPPGELNVYGPSNPALATLPETSTVHLGFTAKRTISTGADTEVYGLLRDTTTAGSFISVGRINDNSISQGNPQPQDHVALVIDPNTQRALAAFGSYEVASGEGYTTVYVSLFNSTLKKWVTGSDLSVFYRQNVTRNFVLFCDAQSPPVCERGISDGWNAFSPALAVTPAGKIYFSFMAGPQSGEGYRPYLIPFDFNAPTPGSASVKGWFVPSAKRGGESPAANPVLNVGMVGPMSLSFATDSQISAYVVYVEGTGSNLSSPNRPIFVPFP